MKSFIGMYIRDDPVSSVAYQTLNSISWDPYFASLKSNSHQIEFLDLMKSQLKLNFVWLRKFRLYEPNSIVDLC